MSYIEKPYEYFKFKNKKEKEKFLIFFNKIKKKIGGRLARPYTKTEIGFTYKQVY